MMHKECWLARFFFTSKANFPCAFNSRRKILPCPEQPSRTQAGLTLVELLVVLAIVALGWFTLLPRLDPTDASSAKDKPLAEVNQMLARAGAAALTHGRFQELSIEGRQGRLVWGEEAIRLPSPVAECRINAESCLVPEAIFRAYPHGGMDRLDLALFSGERWTSADLATRLVQAGSQGSY